METNTFKHLFICYLSRGSYSCTCRYSLSRLLEISRFPHPTIIASIDYWPSCFCKLLKQ